MISVNPHPNKLSYISQAPSLNSLKLETSYPGAVICPSLYASMDISHPPSLNRLELDVQSKQATHPHLSMRSPRTSIIPSINQKKGLISSSLHVMIRFPQYQPSPSHNKLQIPPSRNRLQLQPTTISHPPSNQNKAQTIQPSPPNCQNTANCT